MSEPEERSSRAPGFWRGIKRQVARKGLGKRSAPIMKKSVFITGMPASGKSLACKELSRLGYEAHDIEDLRGMFRMIRKGTGENFKNYDNADIEKVKNANWVCDTNKLKKLLQKQKEETAFYCGVATNNDEVA